MQLLKYRLKLAPINHIFISHLHGDHYYGLMGIVSTFHLYGRIKPLHIYAPKALEALINHHLEVSKTTLNYPLIFNPLEDFEGKDLYSDAVLRIRAFPLKHKLPTWGFRFCELERRPKIKKEFVGDHKPCIEAIRRIKDGADFETKEGELLKNEDITHAAPCPRSYAYCSDTAYHPPLTKYLKEVNLLYHEATFDNSMEEMAKEKFHSTAAQAAQLASDSQAGELLLGHFSARFKDPSILLQQAQAVFKSTYLTKEGNSYSVR